MRKLVTVLALVAVLATGCARKSEPKVDRFAGMSPEGRKLAEEFERSRIELAEELDAMSREIDAIMPALDEVTEQAIREAERLTREGR